MKYNDETSTRAGAKRVWRRRPAEMLCAAILLLMAVNFLTVLPRKSITIDESLLIPAGYYHLAAYNFRPIGEHPPLAKVLSAVPLLFIGTIAPPITEKEAASKAYTDYNNLYWKFWRANREQVNRLSFWSRVPLIALTLGLGVLIFVYARRLFGARAAVLSVALFSIEPTVLAHGRVVQTDIPVAFAFLLFCFVFYDYLRAPTLRRAVYVGAVSALALVAKFSMVVLAPILVMTSLMSILTARKMGERRARFAAHAAAAALTAIVVINAAYLFQTHPLAEFSLAGAGFSSDVEAGATGHVLSLIKTVLPRIIPADCIEGIAWQLGHNRSGHQAGLLGQFSDRGWWYYFPVAFALKTTLPFLLLSLASIAWAVWSFYKKRERTFLLLLVPLGFYTALMLISSINIGVRYFLPAYPFLFILGGAFLDWLLRSNRARTAAALAVGVAFVWMSFEAARAYPNYMPYMNQLASGAPHWYYLSDSNVEWGDDIREMAMYLHARGERQVAVAVLNWGMLDIYNIAPVGVPDPRDPPPAHAPRYVAIGASFFNGSVISKLTDEGVWLSDEERRDFFAPYRARTPEAVFGNSLYLYRNSE